MGGGTGAARDRGALPEITPVCDPGLAVGYREGRGDETVESVRGEICAVWPTDGSVVIDAGFGEQGGIAKGFEDRTEEARGEIDFSGEAVGKGQAENVGTDSCDLGDSIH
jgi:hypothetical protein